MRTLSKNLAAVWVLLLLTAACTSMGLQSATSLDQKIAYAYGTHTAVLTAAGNALEAGSITADDASQVLRLADESRVLLDGARLAATGGDVATAEGRLTLATNLLQQLLDYLNAKGKP